jgi:F0F1-type ATP synthase membrane subunit b/b'
MQDFNRKVEDAFRNVETKIHEAAPHLNQQVAAATEKIEKDAQELIAYLNSEVVPAIRTQSTKALRVASEKLNDLAAYIEQHRQG